MGRSEVEAAVAEAETTPASHARSTPPWARRLAWPVLFGGAGFLALCLVQTGRGQHHSRGAEAALKALRGQEAPLHRMQFISVRTFRSRQPLDRCHLASFGTESGRDTAVDRLIAEQHRAGAAISRVAAFFDAEPAKIAQECAEALPGIRQFVTLGAVDPDDHIGAVSASSRLICSANRKVM